MSYLFTPPWEERLKNLKQNGVMFLTVQDVAHMTSLSEVTVKRLCASGELDAFKIKGRWCIYLDSFIDFTKKKYVLNISD